MVSLYYVPLYLAYPARATEEEEEIDIDLEDPATEKAALKIQAGFRGHKTRKELGSKEGSRQGAQLFHLLHVCSLWCPFYYS
jgi:hypothetical protein